MLHDPKIIKVVFYVTGTILLGLIMIFLKLCGIITASWVWCLAPFWIPIFMSFSFWLAYIILKYIANYLEGP